MSTALAAASVGAPARRSAGEPVGELAVGRPPPHRDQLPRVEQKCGQQSSGARSSQDEWAGLRLDRQRPEHPEQHGSSDDVATSERRRRSAKNAMQHLGSGTAAGRQRDGSGTAATSMTLALDGRTEAADDKRK